MDKKTKFKNAPRLWGTFDSTFIPTCPESRRRQEDAVSPAVHSKQVMQVFVLTTEKSMNINEPFSSICFHFTTKRTKTQCLGILLITDILWYITIFVKIYIEMMVDNCCIWLPSYPSYNLYSSTPALTQDPILPSFTKFIRATTVVDFIGKGVPAFIKTDGYSYLHPPNRTHPKWHNLRKMLLPHVAMNRAGAFSVRSCSKFAIVSEVQMTAPRIPQRFSRIYCPLDLQKIWYQRIEWAHLGKFRMSDEFHLFRKKDENRRSTSYKVTGSSTCQRPNPGKCQGSYSLPVGLAMQLHAGCLCSATNATKQYQAINMNGWAEWQDIKRIASRKEVWTQNSGQGDHISVVTSLPAAPKGHWQWSFPIRPWCDFIKCELHVVKKISNVWKSACPRLPFAKSSASFLS